MILCELPSRVTVIEPRKVRLHSLEVIKYISKPKLKVYFEARPSVARQARVGMWRRSVPR